MSGQHARHRHNLEARTRSLCLASVGMLASAAMSNSRSNAGTVDVDGVSYDWRLLREPHLSDDEGWRGMAISLLQQGAKREAWVEFPPPKRLIKGLPRGRLQLDDATISRCVRAAMSAGWEPMSRGRPIMFMVGADGN